MPKVANRYLKVDPYKLIEEGFNKERAMVSESLFSLSNEYHGVRGFFEEGISNVETLVGTYYNGVYAKGVDLGAVAYKGVVTKTHYMVNSPNFLKVRIVINGITIDLGKIEVENFKRVLDLKTGVLTRTFRYNVDDKKYVDITFMRFLSKSMYRGSIQKISFYSNSLVNIELSFYLDASIKHWGNKNHYEVISSHSKNNELYIHSKVDNTDFYLSSLSKVICSKNIKYSNEVLDKEVVLHYHFELNGDVSFERYNINDVLTALSDSPYHSSHRFLEVLMNSGFDNELKCSARYYEDLYDKVDIRIVGDDLNQQGIRFCIFALDSTYHGLSQDNNIGAKGLTGEAYSGHTFWDTEVLCLQYYLLNNLDAAKNLLLYRYKTLHQARARAKELDCLGACYPIATLNGEEACTLWQHASLQFQPSTAVSYGIYHYMNLSNDYQFMKEYGLEMLIEISKFLLTRGSYDKNNKYFSFYNVMGPDEFQMMVNHNSYTNFMARETFKYTVSTFNLLVNELNVDELFKKTKIDSSFFTKLEKVIGDMKLLYDESTLLYEQHDGFFNLPHVDINKIPETDFPLYHHWSYDRIYRNDMIKQPDVLMFFFLYPEAFSMKQLKANYDYYEPLTIHESSLSPSVHSILASKLNYKDEALKFFLFATRLDLDDYNRNTREGLHLTSIAAAYVNIIYGFAGISTTAKHLTINPNIPEKWESLSFKITYFKRVISFEISKEKLVVSSESEGVSKLIIKDKEYILDEQLVVDLK